MTATRLAPGMHFVGPAVIEDPGTTIVVHPGNRVSIDGYGNIHIALKGRRPNEHDDPITQEIIQNSLQAAADEMFAAMRKTAMSSIIYEVLDMGTGITDADGRARLFGRGHPGLHRRARQGGQGHHRQAPSPATSEPGDVFVTNDPYYGGVTHLNDIIVVMPVFVG
jgi:hypothetical protein